MALETGDYVADLVITNPLGSDAKSLGDDHLRLCKKVLRESFAGFTSAILVSGTDGGAANTYTLTPTTALIAYGAKMLVEFTPAATNTGASTLNISALGAKNIYSVAGAALAAGDLVSGCYYLAVYDGTQFRLLSTTKNYVDQLAFSAALPSQTGNSGKLVTTDGSASSWTAVKTINSASILGSGNIAITSGLTLLGTATPTAAANLDDFLSTFTSTYDNYEIIVEGILPASGTPPLYLRVANAGTADGGSVYYTGDINSTSGFTTAAAFHVIISNVFATGKGCGASIRISNVNDATNLKLIESRSGCQIDAVPTFFTSAKTSIYNPANAVSGFRLYWAGGQDFAAVGKVRVYGYSNS